MAVTAYFYDKETGVTYTRDNVPPEKLEKLRERWFTSLAKMVSGEVVLNRKEAPYATQRAVGKPPNRRQSDAG
ncbi:MAG: hypothetical protein M0021_09655 [Clostridia bacterium]|nr:hypothetical protein [Clostridia bacterium]